MGDWVDWRYGKIGVGALFGILLVAVSLTMILLDLLRITRQVTPPPFLGDFIPSVQQVCTEIMDGRAGVERSNDQFDALGWPEWPDPEVVSCDATHRPAPSGAVRWHSCDSLRRVDNELSPPCPHEGRGAVHARLGDGGEVVAVDIYVRDVSPKHCAWAHEEGHARGFLVTPDEDDQTPYVSGAHTEKPGHLMGESCGYGLKWLDRRSGGDWPYGEEAP